MKHTYEELEEENRQLKQQLQNIHKSYIATFKQLQNQNDQILEQLFKGRR